MGYRVYIGFMPRKEYDKIKSLTKQEVFDYYDLKPEFEGDEPHKDVYEFGKELYEFGKYCEFNPPEGSMKPFFKNKETQDHWGDENEFYVVAKNFLAYIINYYKEKIKKYYNDMLTPFYGKTDKLFDRDDPSDFLNSVNTDYGSLGNKHKFDFSKITDDEQTALFKIFKHMRSMRAEWYLSIFNLEQGDEVTRSWKYEYSIFELVRIYKSFDWRKHVMIYYGY